MQRRVLQQGETMAGSAIFFLDAPVDQYRQVSGCALHIHDYSGRQSKHKLPLEPSWYKGIEKGIILIDAPVREVDGILSWEGIAIGKHLA